MKNYLIALVFLLPLSAGAADYWPLHPDGVVYQYDGHTATFVHDSAFTGIERETPSGCQMGEQYIEVDGQVAICGSWGAIKSLFK